MCNNSLLATAGKLQKVGTAVLGNNVKTVISGLDLFSSASAKWTKSMYCLMLGKLLETKYVDISTLCCDLKKRLELA